MKKKRIIILVVLGLLIVGGISAAFIWNYANEAVADVAKVESDYSFTSEQLLEMAAAAEQHQEKIGQVVTVSGFVSSIKKDDEMPTLELAQEGDMSSVVVQIDKRHVDEVEQLKVRDAVRVKGRLVGLSADDMGLGNTAEIKNASIMK